MEDSGIIIFSNPVMRALNNHPTLNGVFGREDILTQARNLDDHRGYQTWHRNIDAEVVTWLNNNPAATQQEFLEFLLQVYQSPDMQASFPDAATLIQHAIDALQGQDEQEGDAP